MIGPPRMEDLPQAFTVLGATLLPMDENLPGQIHGAGLVVRNGFIDDIVVGGKEANPDIAHLPSIDAGGRVVMPGLTDGHAHLDRETLGSDLPAFTGARTCDDLLDILAEEVAQRKPGEWIVTNPLGTAPDYLDADRPFEDGRLPDRYTLDSVSPNNPVFIRPIWGYWNVRASKLSFANSLALAGCGITARTTSPHPDLEIVRDGCGEPTGQFVETSQQPMIEHTLLRSAPGFTHEQRTDAILRAFNRYAACGTTAIYEGHGVAGEVMDAYVAAYASNGHRKLRACLPLSPSLPHTSDVSADLKTWERLIEHHSDQLATVDGIFVEPAEDMSRFELMAANHPRTGWAGFSPGAVVPIARLEDALLVCARAGVRVSGISSGMLEVMARVDRVHPVRGLRWTLGHQAALSEKEIQLAADLGTLMTTITGHHIHRGSAHPLIGTARENEILPVRSLVNAGVPVVLGTDNRPISLWESVKHVVTREDATGNFVAPDQAVTRYEALRLITANGAVLTGESSSRGVFRRGYEASFAILDRNPLECQERELPGTRSVGTVVAGRAVSSDASALRVS